MKTLYFILTLFLISCVNNSEKDIFSDRNINFKKLNLDNDIAYENKYDIPDIKVRLIPLNNSIKLSDEEKNYIIKNTGYVEDLYYIESMFWEEKTKTTCLVDYMRDDNNSLGKLINYINKMKRENNILKNYFYVNGKNNIQYKIQLDDTILFYTIFEPKDSNYLVLSYTFPTHSEYTSMENIANSINSVEFY
ncbi:hypothetical protein OFR42_01660 [Brachyspira hyodysenteriae]|nr:hypothetical protein [Brachyspira hyodysenteriae]MDA0039380.1 hypothetical protein [Brachyspira hyodysenteriae]